MQITVKQDHIDAGDPRCPMFCPIALAIRERFPNAIYVLVRKSGISIDSFKPNVRNKTFHHSYDIPKKARRFIANFDNYDHVEPFTFELREKPKTFFGRIRRFFGC